MRAVSTLALAAALMLAGPALAQYDTDQQAATPQGQADQRPMMGMRGMDTNNDGTITREEFDAGHQGADIRFQSADTDRDGAVSRKEFDALGQARRNQAFADLDANKDGKLSPDEMESRRTAMFDRMDANRDGRITAEEMGPGKMGHGPGMMGPAPR